MSTIKERRELIRQRFIDTFGVNGLKELQRRHLSFLLTEYNSLFLNNSINPKRVKFRTKSVSPFMAAYSESNNGKGETVVIDSYILQNSNYGYVGGIECTTSLECLQLLFEHELVHLLLYLNGEQYQALGHNKRYTSLLKQLFGHTSYTTSLINDVIKRIDSNTTLKSGDQVWIVSPKNPTLEYMGVIRDVLPNDTYLVEAYTGEVLSLGRKNLLFFVRTKK